MWQPTGILQYNLGASVDIGYRCCRCEDYAVLRMSTDDYNEEVLTTSLCDNCEMRDRLAQQLRGFRAAMRYVRFLEKEVEIRDSLIQSGSEIVTGLDEVIRNLRKNKLDKKHKA